MKKSSQKPCIQILDEVSEVLAHFRLKLAENVWASDVPIKSEKFLQSRAEFDNGCKFLWTLKDLVNVIGPMYQCLNTKLKEMSRVMESALIRPSYHYGLESLPNENFMCILDLLAETCTTYTDRMRLVKNLSSVSRRFRDGVVNTTSFWVYWDTRYCLDDGFEHRLVRTKEALLFIDVSVEWGEQEEIFTRILPHRTRWHRVKLFHRNTGILGQLGAIFPMVDFPSVRSLVINTVTSPSHGDTFFAEWTFPNVSSVALRNVIPPPGAFPKATSLRLRGGSVRILKLTTLLRSMAALTTLDLDVSYTVTTESLTVELPSITTFSIANHDNRNQLASIECIGNFTRALKLPNVENFILRLCLKKKEESEKWVSKIFNKDIPFRSVKDFRLTVTSMTSKSFKLFFDGFSSRFPNLHSLRMEGFESQIEFGGERITLAKSFDRLEGRLPHLHSLTVLNMENDWSRFCEWFTSLSEKGAVIHHLSISKMDWIDICDIFKRNNADIELKVLPDTFYNNEES